MTRIAGTSAPGQTSIEGPLTNAAGAAPNVATVDVSGSPPHGVPLDAGPDRPLPTQCTGARAVPLDGSVFLREITRWEGEQRNMYIDTRGYVTTGIGHLLQTSGDALKLPWQHSSTGQPATPAEIKSAFGRLAQAWVDYKSSHPDAKGLPQTNCERASDLVLPGNLPTKLAVARLNGEFLKGLRKTFPAFDSFPMPAQRALVDMAYNLGVAKLERRFPRLVAACRQPRPDFATAAAESHRSSSRESRNRATYNLFMDASRLTESVQVLKREIRS